MIFVVFVVKSFNKPVQLDALKIIQSDVFSIVTVIIKNKKECVMRPSRFFVNALAVSFLILAMLACNFGRSVATPTPLPPTNPPPTAIPPTQAPPVVESSPTPENTTPPVDTGAFDTLLKDFASKGYVTTTEGETTPIDPFKNEWAQINYYDFWNVDKEASDLVFSSHFKWSSSSSTPDLSGCGVAFGLQENGDHYVVFLDKGRIAFFMSRGSNVYEVGKTRGPGRVNFGNPADADFALAVKGKSAYVSVDGEVTEYTLSADQTTLGNFALSMVSGTNSGYGTRCEMTDSFLFIPK